MFARIGQRFLHKTEHGGFRVGGQPVRLRFAGHMPGHHQMTIKQRIDVGISGTATRTEHIEQTLHIMLRAFGLMPNRTIVCLAMARSCAPHTGRHPTAQ